MELQLVTFEQAKSLKELGFPQDDFYNHYYTEDGKRYWMKMSDDYGNSWSIGQYHFSCVAPTLEAVAKWLREEKDFDIEPHREGDKYTLLYTWFDNRINGYNVEYIDDISGECKCFEFNTYEEALSAGIDKAIEILSNKQMENILNEYADYEYVDLGLPSGTLWAKCNVGAKSETDYGDYFMWGSTVPDTNTPCDWAHMPFNNGKGKFDSTYFNAHKSEWMDNNVLKPEYDAAHVIMGGNWRMPTKADWEEMTNNTIYEWVENYKGSGVNGRLYTSVKNRKTLFVPAAGYRDRSYFYDQGDIGRVWSPMLYLDNSNYAWRLGFNSGGCYMDYYSRYFAYSVRGVMKR